MNVGDLFDSPLKIAIIAIFIIILFGSRKLPEAARSLGKSMRILKREIRDLREDDELDTTTTAVSSVPVQLETPAASASPAAPDAQVQIDALSKQLADLQQSVAAKNTDGAQAK